MIEVGGPRGQVAARPKGTTEAGGIGNVVAQDQNLGKAQEPTVEEGLIYRPTVRMFDRQLITHSLEARVDLIELFRERRIMWPEAGLHRRLEKVRQVHPILEPTEVEHRHGDLLYVPSGQIDTFDHTMTLEVEMPRRLNSNLMPARLHVGVQQAFSKVQ